jgi:hypothetical protein
MCAGIPPIHFPAVSSGGVEKVGAEKFRGVFGSGFDGFEEFAVAGVGAVIEDDPKPQESEPAAPVEEVPSKAPEAPNERAVARQKELQERLKRYG